MRYFKIGNIRINKKTPPVIIAEIGINHNGKLIEAIKIASEAIKSGADIIKHQTHIVSDEMALSAKKVIPRNSKKSIYEIIDSCSLQEEDEFKLMQFVKSKKKIFISTPFSRAAVDRLEKFKIPAYKRVDIGFSKDLADYQSKKIPVFISEYFQSLSLHAEIFNLLNFKNTASYLWLNDKDSNQYAVPNYLTFRRLNFRLIAKLKTR
jgi:N-acetylneuraminate synthase